MSQDIATLVLRVQSLEARAAADDVRKLAKEGAKAEGVFKGFGRTMAGLGIGTAIGALLGSMIKNTIEAEESTAQLEARLKSTGGVAGQTLESLQNLATGLQGLTTYDDEAIQGAEALMLTFTKVGGEVFPLAIKSALNMATALGTDLNGATLQLGKALNDPIKGITALSRAGVQFSEDQKAMIKTLVETGRQADAQKIILKELETQMGGAAEAARNTLGGALKGLENDFANLLEGDSGSDGVRGATAEVNNLAATMRSPQVQAGFQSFISLLFKTLGVIAETSSALINLASGMDAFGRSQGQAQYDKNLRRESDLTEQIMEMRKEGAKYTSPFASGGVRSIDALQKELDGLKKLNAEYRNTAATQTAVQKAMQTSTPGAVGGTVDTAGAAAARAAAEQREKDAKAAAAAAKRSRESAAKEQAAALEGLRQSLRTEEEAIAESYAEREKIINNATGITEDQRQQLHDRSMAQRDAELAELNSKNVQELEDLRKSLRTQEEEIAESYAARMEIIRKNTAEGSDQRVQLEQREKARRDEELQAIADAEQAKRDSLYAGLLTEEEMLKESHERKRAEILESTAVTEAERQDLLRREEEKFMEESANRERQRLQMITSSAGDMFGALSSLMSTYAQGSSKESKKLFKIAQAFSIAQSIMGIATGISKAQELGYPMNIFEAIRVAAVGAVQIATIKNQQFAGNYDEGGYIPANKWGNVGEKGVERVRGPAYVTGRVATARAEREDERRRRDLLVQHRTTNHVNVTVMPGADRRTADQAADAMLDRLDRVSARNR